MLKVIPAFILYLCRSVGIRSFQRLNWGGPPADRFIKTCSVPDHSNYIQKQKSFRDSIQCSRNNRIIAFGLWHQFITMTLPTRRGSQQLISDAANGQLIISVCLFRHKINFDAPIRLWRGRSIPISFQFIRDETSSI